MSTNYYHYSNICDHCGRSDELHIGKFSSGWEFSFRGYTGEDGELLIDSCANWMERLREGVIKDEYGTEIPFEEFCALVMRTKGMKSYYDETLARYGAAFLQDDWKDADGWSFSFSPFS